MSKDTVSLVIEATDGRPMRHYSHDGKTFVESPETRAYQLRVKNKTGHRVKAVISVDSLNIISGAPASNDPNETGYLLQPHEEQVFKGFRVDDDTVAQFTFVKREQSYATERGEGAGNGVIAMRVYAEKQKPTKDLAEVWRKLYEEERNKPREKEYVYPIRPWYWEDDWYRPRYPRPYFGDVWSGGYVKGTTTTTEGWGGNGVIGSSNLIACASIQGAGQSQGVSLTNCAFSAQNVGDNAVSSLQCKADETPFSMGSKWGDAVKESVKTVEFEVGELLVETTIYYTTLEGLKALGVNVERVKQVVFPQAFKGYCPKPSGWQG